MAFDPDCITVTAPVELTPEEVSLLDPTTHYWTEDYFIKKTHRDYLETSTDEVINTALLLHSNNMLNKKNIEFLVTLLDGITSPLQPHGGITIIDKILAQALTGTESDCKSMLKLLIPLIDKSTCLGAKRHIFSSIYRVFDTDIPSQDELETGLNKNPGIGKLYFLKANLYQLEIAIRKLLRASFITGILFLQGIGDGMNLVPDFQRLLSNLIGTTVTMQSFHTVCAILITVSEQRRTWGYREGREVEKSFLKRLETDFEDFLTYREKNDEEEPETGDFLLEISSRAFRALHPNWEWADFNVPSSTNNDVPIIDVSPPLQRQRPDTDLLILKRRYSRIYKLAYANHRRAFSGPESPTFPPGTPRSNELEDTWQSEMENIAILLHYSRHPRLEGDKQSQDKVKKEEKTEEKAGSSSSSSWITGPRIRKIKNMLAQGRSVAGTSSLTMVEEG